MRARRIWEHAGVAERVDVVVGHLGDGDATADRPKYRAFMREHEGVDWRTVENPTHVEYQTLIKDLVLESTYRP